MTELSTDRRFHNLTKEQVKTLDQVLTEVIPIHGRGNFPTLEIKPKDIIHVVRHKLIEKHIKVRDVRLNGSTASHVLVKENGTSYKDLDIIFGVELPKQEDFQIIKEVVLGCLLDFLPRGVNKDKITALTMKEAYVQKMVKVFNEHDRWSLISLSNNSGKNVELKFVSSLRRQFEFSVDSFQIILDRMLESYLEAERKQEAQCKNMERTASVSNREELPAPPAEQHNSSPSDLTESNLDQPGKVEDVPNTEEEPCCHKEDVSQEGEWPSLMDEAPADMMDPAEEMEINEPEPDTETKTEVEPASKIKDIEKTTMAVETDANTSTTEVKGPVKTSPKHEKLSTVEIQKSETPEPAEFVNDPVLPLEKTPTKDADVVNSVCESVFKSCTCPKQKPQDSYSEFPLPPPAKKSYKKSQMVVLKHSSPKPPRKMSKKVTSGSLSLARVPSVNEPPFLTTQPLGPAKINPEESIPIPDKVPSLVCSESLISPSQDKDCRVKNSDAPVITHTVTTHEDDIRPNAKTMCSPPDESKTSILEVQAENIESDGMVLNKIDKNFLTLNACEDMPSTTCHFPEPPAQVPNFTVSVTSRPIQVSEVIVQVPEHPVQLHDSAVQVPEPSIYEPPQSTQRTEFETQEIQSPEQGTTHDVPAVELAHQVTELASQVTYPLSTVSEAAAQVLESIFEESSQGGNTQTEDKSENHVAEIELPDITVVAESMYGDFEQALDHLRYRLIATRNPEEIRGGGLLKYSNLLVREFKPASETEIKTLERYMCSRFFIDFPDVNEQQRKIESYLRNHFIGEEKSKYDYLMTLRRVVNESTVCLMGHERRQTLNMITILALKVLGEQNIIPNTTNVTCYYQPAPYMADHNFNNYYIAHGQPPLIYHPYPLHMHIETGLV